MKETETVLDHAFGFQTHNSSSSGPVDIGLWIDWDSNGTFEGFFPFTSVAAGGLHTDQITVPSAGSYTEGNSVFVRARVFPSGGAPGGTLDLTDYVGLASDGEVEDYLWDFGPNAITLNEINIIAGTNSNLQTVGVIVLLL